MASFLEKVVEKVSDGGHVDCTLSVTFTSRGRVNNDIFTFNLANPRLRNIMGEVLDHLLEKERWTGIEAMKEEYMKYYGVEMPEPEGI
jgi:hypothetical protein